MSEIPVPSCFVCGEDDDPLVLGIDDRDMVLMHEVCAENCVICGYLVEVFSVGQEVEGGGMAHEMCLIAECYFCGIGLLDDYGVCMKCADINAADNAL